MKANYHTHTYLCGHANGDVEDYVKKAVEVGLEEIGFTEHAPFPERLLKPKPNMRMLPSDLEGYVQRINQCKEKYNGQISIRAGLEIEFIKEAYNEGYYDEMLKKVEFLILGQHIIPNGTETISSFFFSKAEHVLQYGDTVVEALETGLFRFVAHPDVFCRSYVNWDEACEITARKIIGKCAELNIPIEVNANGVRLGQIKADNKYTYRYPRTEFWEIASEYDVKVMYNADAHTPNDLADHAMEACREFIKKYNLKLVEKLEF